MADTFTPSLNLCKPEINQSAQTWGIKLNSDLDLLDAHAAAMKAFQAGNDARINALIAAALPRGCIIAWSGGAGNIPAGWLLCNGANGTPNLTDRFILGNTGNRTNWEAGGAFLSPFATTDAKGFHSHGGITADTTLTAAQMPSHYHTGATDAQGDHAHSVPGAWGANGGGANVAVGGGFFTGNALPTTVNGAHQHNFFTTYQGADQPHHHGISAEANHSHTVSVNVTPPYFSLAYLMRA
jgi:hypothetical protein